MRRQAEIQSLMFVPDDWNYVVFGELRKDKAALFRWDWNSNSLVDWGEFATPKQNSIGCLNFAAGGGMLGAGVGAVAVTWKIENGAATARKNYKGMDQSIRAIAISHDHELLAAAGQHGSLRFWNLQKSSWNYTGFQVRSQIAAVSMIRFSPDGSLLAMAGLDNRVAVWNMAGECDRSVRMLSGHASNVLYVQFIGGGSHLVSVGADGQVIFWDIEDSSIIQEFKIDLALAYRLDISGDGARLVVGFANGNVAVYCLDLPA
jgi:WD40 repeat protein